MTPEAAFGLVYKIRITKNITSFYLIHGLENLPGSESREVGKATLMQTNYIVYTRTVKATFG